MKQAWFIAAALVLSGAATAQDAKPDVVVSTEGSVQLPNGSVVANGASAGVNEGQTIQVTGSAIVTYSNGCQVTVQDRAYTINETGCVPSSATVRGATAERTYVVAGLGVAAAVAASVAGGGSDDKPSSP